MTLANSVPVSSGKSVDVVRPAYQHDGVTIYQGDVLAVLPQLERESVHCVVTSPPYWGLRDYGTATWEGGKPECDHREKEIRFRRNLAEAANASDGGSRSQADRADGDLWLPYREVCGKCGARRIDSQIGLEPTPEEYIAKMLDVFREVRRVLRDDGTLWLNMGDSYVSQPNQRGLDDLTELPAKNLVGMPWRLALALQADGWYLRSDIIWAKPNPMPESVTDRPTKSHEYIFLLSKSEHYYYDAEAIKEEAAEPTGGRQRAALNGDVRYVGTVGDEYHEGRPGRFSEYQPPSRNKRSVWTVGTEPFPEAHFATFPQELIKPCILAGCPDKCCANCGAPWERITELTRSFQGWRTDTAVERDDKHGPARLQGGGETYDVRRGPVVHSTTLGWQPTCECFFQGELAPQEKLHIAQQKGWLRPGVVLDPFFGSGTTGQVARQNGCHVIGIELNAEYIEIAARRLSQATLNFVTPEAAPAAEASTQEKLFA
jgi:DNA modification methylase